MICDESSSSSSSKQASRSGHGSPPPTSKAKTFNLPSSPTSTGNLSSSFLFNSKDSPDIVHQASIAGEKPVVVIQPSVAALPAAEQAPPATTRSLPSSPEHPNGRFVRRPAPLVLNAPPSAFHSRLERLVSPKVRRGTAPMVKSTLDGLVSEGEPRQRSYSDPTVSFRRMNLNAIAEDEEEEEEEDDGPTRSAEKGRPRSACPPRHSASAGTSTSTSNPDIFATGPLAPARFGRSASGPSSVLHPTSLSPSTPEPTSHRPRSSNVSRAPGGPGSTCFSTQLSPRMARSSPLASPRGSMSSASS